MNVTGVVDMLGCGGTRAHISDTAAFNQAQPREHCAFGWAPRAELAGAPAPRPPQPLGSASVNEDPENSYPSPYKRPWELEQGWKGGLSPRPASQLLCWTPSEAWPAEVKCIRAHYRSLPGQFRPQAGDSWQPAQGTGKDMPLRGRSPGGLEKDWVSWSYQGTQTEAASQWRHSHS